MSANRIDGWKAIGLYLGRERTTVIRWARTRNLPVHRMPGGEKATVYALKDELDRWVANEAVNEPEAGSDADERGISAPAPAPAPAPPFAAWRLIAACAALLLVAGFALSSSWRGPAEPERSASVLPADPVSARLYLQARDDWAKRTPEGLDRAIAALEQVTMREPGFALAYSALADAYLLAREFASMRDAEAFARARKAADRSLMLDPLQAPAHRALGFILYWWERDPRAAGLAFRRAIDLAPDSAQTHFWYGNILSDNGEHAAALRELDAARLLEPGSIAIQSDRAYALWASGRTSEGVAELEQLARTVPGFAGIDDCLADIRLANGDYAGYVERFGNMVRLRREPQRQAQAARFARALRQGTAAVQVALMQAALQDIARSDRVDHVWPAFLASVAGDREQLLRMLRAAGGRKEFWGNAGLTARIAAAWPDDPAITPLLAARRAPPIES